MSLIRVLDNRGIHLSVELQWFMSANLCGLLCRLVEMIQRRWWTWIGNLRSSVGKPCMGTCNVDPRESELPDPVHILRRCGRDAKNWIHYNPVLSPYSIILNSHYSFRANTFTIRIYISTNFWASVLRSTVALHFSPCRNMASRLRCVVYK